jgi:ribosomal protein S18 acetylase RimI-like enzyme
MTATVADTDKSFNGLRPFNPLRDIRPAVDLIELSFAQDLDQESRQALNEMRTLAGLLGPLLWLLGKTPSAASALFSGFVWVEEGRIVGNVTVQRPQGKRRGWFISNLAVHPDYRRRGIAERLVSEGLDVVRQKGGKRVSLEVRVNNVAAKKLYEKLGFSWADSVSKMTLEQIEGYSVVRVQPTEWEKQFELAQTAFTTDAKEITPIELADYRLNPLRRLAATILDLFKGQETLQWAAQCEDSFAALLTLRTGSALFAHRLSLMVHPRHRGKVEESLLTTALFTLGSYPSRPALARIQPAYEEGLNIFKGYGFVEEQTLDLLTLHL